MNTVLLSGGLDSTVLLGSVLSVMTGRTAGVSFRYGQKHDKELYAAEAVAEYYEIEHFIIDLESTGVYGYSDCSLLKSSTARIEKGSYNEQLSRKENGVVATYVPFRNGLMVSAAAALTMSLAPDEISTIFLGAHADDAAGNAYPDCSISFVKKMESAIMEGTSNLVHVSAPFVSKTKAKIVEIGLEQTKEVPFHLTWSCYEGGDLACGQCATCIDRLRAFAENNTNDPVNYAGWVEY